MWIDGMLHQASDGRTTPVIDPATEAVIGHAARGGPAEVDLAMAAARRASPAWRTTPGIERAMLLHGLAALFRLHLEDWALLLTREVGRPLSETRGEVETCAAICAHYAEIGRSDTGRTVSPGQRGQTNLILKEPYGVVVAITPWNYPLLQLIWKLAPALAAGNTVVAKPAELTPLATLAFAAATGDVLPPGVFNVVTGLGPEAGMPLVTHRDADLVTFTGSTATGAAILAAAAPRIVPVHLELGGSDPLIVCDDVDLDVAARAATWAAFLNNGQVCTSAKRILVFDSVYEAFVEKVVANVRRLRMGDPCAETTDLGPMVSALQRDRLEAQATAIRAEGCKFLTGGQRPPGLAQGWFYEPTVAVNVPRDGVLMRDEVFGPIRPIVAVRDLADAIQVANDTPYGLGATIFTTSLERAMDAATGIRAGTVWVNDPLTDNHAAPFGGMKMSGLGRELGPEGLDGFRETKHLVLNHAVEQKSYWFPEAGETTRGGAW